METETFKNDLLPAIERWQAAGERIAVATVVRVVGTVPRREGAKLAVSERGDIAGSVSGGCVEGAVVEEALRVLRTGRPRETTRCPCRKNRKVAPVPGNLPVLVNGCDC